MVECFDFLYSSIIMSEQAPLSIGAVQFPDESIALLRLILYILWLLLVNQLKVAMRELAFGPISAGTHFDPVFTQLRFEFSLVSLQRLRLVTLLRGTQRNNI
jgi:hypothetical protein